jgi:hypothetical protein
MRDQIHEELVFIEEYAKEFAFKSLHPTKGLCMQITGQTVLVDRVDLQVLANDQVIVGLISKLEYVFLWLRISQYTSSSYSALRHLLLNP